MKNTAILERRFVPKGQILIREGEYGQDAYLVQSGELSVFITKDGEDVELARLGAGQIVGEMAFVFDAPRTASVRATQDSNLIVISRQQFEEKLRESDPTVRAIVQMLSQRIVDSNNTLLNKKSDLDDLRETARVIYQNISLKLTRNQQRNFQNTVLPHLEALLDSLDTFQERYGAAEE
ncbi:MAG TPA: cyclic nucleotide-binding domain-containing protein [Micavibrio sp.]|nr:cyclic nucleotide-binding domain-containing protein [Micavibrio sp.]